MTKKTFISIFLFTFIALFMSFCTNDSTGPEDVNPWTYGKMMTLADDKLLNDTLCAIFRYDAVNLALDQIIADTALKYSQVEIPEELIQIYYNGLIHIYSANDIAARNSVVKYMIHTFCIYKPYEILMGVDSDCTWVANWVNIDSLCGVEELDKLISEWGLTVKQVKEYPSEYMIVFKVERDLNLFALTSLFNNIDVIQYTQPNFINGDGSTIIAEIQPDWIHYTFYLKWGDCPAGCVYKHRWNFNVSYDGSVAFTGSGGSSVPSNFDDSDYPWDLYLEFYYRQLFP